MWISKAFQVITVYAIRDLIPVPAIDGRSIDEDYEGRLPRCQYSTGCGFTPQYEPIEAHEKYHDRYFATSLDKKRYS